jgi:hypothetical protein
MLILYCQRDKKFTFLMSEAKAKGLKILALASAFA